MGNSTYAIFSFPHMCSTPPGRKDPSATLGMTIREDGLSHISFHPATGANLRPCGAPSPRGEGAPQGRIGHKRYERQMRKAEKCAAHVGKRESQAANDKDFSLRSK